MVIEILDLTTYQQMGKKGESQYKQRRQNKNGHEIEERFNNSNGHRHVRDLEQPYVRY